MRTLDFLRVSYRTIARTKSLEPRGIGIVAIAPLAGVDQRLRPQTGVPPEAALS